MANINLDWDGLNRISAESLDDRQERKKILNFLYQLTEQLRYWQNHLELDNMTEEFQQEYKNALGLTVTLRKDLDKVIAKVEDSEIGDFSELVVQIEGIAARVQSVENGMAELNLKYGGLQVDVQNVQGDVSQLKLTANALQTEISSVEGDVSSVQQKADALGVTVGKKLDANKESVGVKNSAMTLTKDEFTLAFDGKNVMEVDEDSAVFDVDTLTATGQIIGNVVNTQKAGSVTVPAGASIQSAIDNLGKYLLGNVYVYVEGQHTENVKLQGFYGMGTLYLSFRSGAVLSGSIEAVYCKSISIIGPSQTACCMISGADECIKIRNVERCNIYHVYMRGSGRNHGIFCEYCMAFIEECTFAGFVYGMEVKANSQVSVYACIGGGAGENALSTYALYVRGGGMATVYGSTRPVGTMYDGGGSGFLRDCGATETSAAGEAPVLSQTMTVTPDSAYGCVSATAAGNSTLVHDWGYYSNPFQGKYSAAGGYMHGIWLFADGLSALRTAIENAQVESAAVTVKRANAYGTDGKTLRLWYHEKTSKPSGSWPSAILTDTGLTATVDRGKSVTFTLTEDLIAKLKSGAIKGFGVSSMRNSDLMQLDGSVCDVTVVYK